MEKDGLNERVPVPRIALDLAYELPNCIRGIVAAEVAEYVDCETHGVEYIKPDLSWVGCELDKGYSIAAEVAIDMLCSLVDVINKKKG